MRTASGEFESKLVANDSYVDDTTRLVQKQIVAHSLALFARAGPFRDQVVNVVSPH